MEAKRTEFRDSGKYLSAVPANADAALRTLTLNVRDCATVLVVFNWTKVASGTAMTITARKRAHTAGLWGKVPSMAINAGTGTVTDFTWSKPVTGSDTVAIDIPTFPAVELELVFGVTGGGATDLINVQVTGGMP
jgi:hypothetical protein